MGKKFNSFINLFALNTDDDYDDENDLFDEEDDDDDDDDMEDVGRRRSGFGLFGGQSKHDDYDDDEDDDDDDDDMSFLKRSSRTASESTRTPQRSSAGSSKFVSINGQRTQKNMNNRGNGTVYVIKPQDFNEAQTVTDYLREGKAIVVNLESIDIEVAQRVIDFIGGSCYALDGSLQAISANIFIAAPDAVDVSGDLRGEILNETILSPDLSKY